jgi:hypothetical protein
LGSSAPNAQAACLSVCGSGDLLDCHQGEANQTVPRTIAAIQSMAAEGSRYPWESYDLATRNPSRSKRGQLERPTPPRQPRSARRRRAVAAANRPFAAIPPVPFKAVATMLGLATAIPLLERQRRGSGFQLPKFDLCPLHNSPHSSHKPFLVRIG